jgi:hypothetical protein
MDGPIVARMRANNALSDLQIRMFDVRRNMSDLTRAPLSMLAQ